MFLCIRILSGFRCLCVFGYYKVFRVFNVFCVLGYYKVLGFLMFLWVRML